MQKIPFLAAVFIAAVGLSSCADFRHAPPIVADNLVTHAADTVERFKTLPQMADFKHEIATARAIVVLPTVFKAGYFVGGEGGNGVLVVRGAEGVWSHPAFTLWPAPASVCRSASRTPRSFSSCAAKRP